MSLFTREIITWNECIFGELFVLLLFMMSYKNKLPILDSERKIGTYYNFVKYQGLFGLLGLLLTAILGGNSYTVEHFSKFSYIYAKLGCCVKKSDRIVHCPVLVAASHNDNNTTLVFYGKLFLNRQ